MERKGQGIEGAWLGRIASDQSACGQDSAPAVPVALVPKDQEDINPGTICSCHLRQLNDRDPVNQETRKERKLLGKLIVNTLRSLWGL